MERTMETQYSEFKQMKGTTKERLHSLGYTIAPEVAGIEINTFDAFTAAIARFSLDNIMPGAMDRETLRALLRRCYKSYLKKCDIVQLLRSGPNGFTNKEVTEALQLLPIDLENGMLVDDLVKMLYE